jgi:PDZ domain-containing protein
VSLRRRARAAPGTAVVAAVAIVVVAVFNLNIPYFAITPGPAENVFDLIKIEGATPKPVSGRLLLTTVSLRKIRVAEAIRGWFDPSYEVLSRSAFVRTGETDADAEREAARQMSESKDHAVAAALRLLGYHVGITPTGARIAELSRGVPARKVLRRGDVIVAADGKRVRIADDFKAVMKHHKVGDVVALQVTRDDKVLSLKARAVGRPDNPAQPIIGVLLENDSKVDVRPIGIHIDSQNIGGPSAGLMYALGIVDLLDAQDLTKGRLIAGTGAIALDGRVEPIGGIRQKIAAARSAHVDLFLAPLVELKEACLRAGTMPVVGVATLKDGVLALRGVPIAHARTCG